MTKLSQRSVLTRRVDMVLLQPGNWPGRTPLCGRQDQYHREMQGHFRPQESEHLDHFQRCSQFICGLFEPYDKTKKVEGDLNIYKVFRSALTDVRPKAKYVEAAGFCTRLLNFFWKWLAPTSWMQARQISMVPMPKSEKTD